MRPTVLLLPFLAACGPADPAASTAPPPSDDPPPSSSSDPADPVDTVEDTGSEVETDTEPDKGLSSTGPIFRSVWLEATVVDFGGDLLAGGELCSDLGCAPIVDGVAQLEVDAEGEVSVWVVSPDHVDVHTPFATHGEDLSLELVAPTHDEVRELAEAFGVVVDPAKGFVLQGIDTNAPVEPGMFVAAEGPFVTDLEGLPLEGARVPTGGGFALFFNVEPGTHEVELPRCREGDGFWGAPDDGLMSIEVAADGGVGLPEVVCDIPTVGAFAQVVEFWGSPRDVGTLCSDIVCDDIVAGVAATELVADADVEMVVEAPDAIPVHYQFHSDRVDMSFFLIASTSLEMHYIASQFGRVLDPWKTQIAQFVQPSSPIVPSFSGNAEGPFLLSLDGLPLEGTTIPPQGAIYLFLNADPGPQTIELPGCLEGDLFWGAPNDGIIEVDGTPGTSIGLFNVGC